MELVLSASNSSKDLAELNQHPQLRCRQGARHQKFTGLETQQVKHTSY